MKFTEATKLHRKSGIWGTPYSVTSRFRDVPIRYPLVRDPLVCD
jgi:hypothetical protein